MKEKKSFEQCYAKSAKLIYNGRKKEKLFISNNFIKEIKNYKNTSKTNILINVARVEKQKNQLMLCECIAELVKEGYDIVLLIIGSKKNRKIVKSIEEINCKRIFLLGECSNPMEYIAMADFFCLSSSWEGMPISLIEAFFTETIPVCTPVGGIKDMIIDNINGFLSKDLSKESYKKALIHCLTITENEKKKIKRNCMKSSEKYSIEDCAKSYLKLINE